MPTAPFDNFIHREINESVLKSALDQFSGRIEECVNYGSQIFRVCLDNIAAGEELLPILMSYRHSYELIDSISVLVKFSSIDPCKILLRSIFESILTIEYILEKNSDQRAADFLVWNTHQEIKFHRRWDAEDQVCKDFRAKLAKDNVLKEWRIIEFPQVKEEINKRKEILGKPKYRESAKEYERLRKKGGSPRWWFSLHNGPRDLERLAEYLNRPGQYEILYRHTSSAAHGTDIIRKKIKRVDDRHVSISQIRLPDDLIFVTQMTINFALTLLRIFTNYFIPQYDHTNRKWYLEEIKDFSDSLKDKRIYGIELE